MAHLLRLKVIQGAGRQVLKLIARHRVSLTVPIYRISSRLTFLRAISGIVVVVFSEFALLLRQFKTLH